MRPKAILLDLDDTIIAFDHGLDLNQIWLSVCSSHLPDFNENQILECIAADYGQQRTALSDILEHLN